MAYPTSVFNPAVRSNGQTIDASHVNDLQTEVTALENALLGTITHSINVSGNSTLAKAQIAASTIVDLVATNSTLANVQVANSTFSVRPVTPPPDVAQVQSTTLNLTNNTTQAITWAQQVFVSNASIHSTGTNPERFTPQSTGVYAFSVTAVLGNAMSASTGMLRLRLLDSSGMELTRAVGGSAGGSGNQFSAAVSCYGVKRFDSLAGSTQWVRAEVIVRDGSTNSLDTVTIAVFHKL